MKKYINYTGIIVIAMGIMMLASCLFLHGGNCDRWLITGLATVFAGVALQVYIMKRQSRY